MKFSPNSIRSALLDMGIWYQPGWRPGESIDQPPTVDFRGRGGKEYSAAQIADILGLPPSEFKTFVDQSINKPDGDPTGLRLSAEEGARLPPITNVVQYNGGGGLFGSFFSFISDVGGGLVDLGKDFLGAVSDVVDTVVDPIANTLGVHPDVVKVAAAALGMYYAPGVGFTDAAGATVSEAAAAEAIAASGAEALAAAGNMEAAAALAAGAESLAVPSMLPGATAFPVATAPLATMGASAPLTAAELAAADASAGLLGSSNALAPAFAPPTNAIIGYGGAGDVLGTASGSLYNPLMSTSVMDSALAGYGGAGDVLNPATGTVTNALATGAGANTISGYGGAGDVLNTATGGVLTGADAATGLGAAAGTGAGAGAGAGTIAGYGGAGDILDPVTGSVISGADAAAITGAGFNLSDFAKFAKDYGVPISALFSAVTGSQAANRAADIQAQSAREARQLARDIFNEQKALQEPYRAAGITAQNQLLNLLGLSGNTAAAEYGKYARPFGMADFQADPGYAFRLSEGMKALEASRAARGGLLSGATGKALQRYGQEMGSQEYGNAFNRYQTERSNRLQPLSGLTTLGQAAAANQGAAAGAFGATAGNLTTDIGAAQAAGGIGSANAITNALNQFARYSAGQNLANQIRSSVYA